MVGTIAVSGYGATITIRLSPGHAIEWRRTSTGQSGSLYEAVGKAVLAMRAENGGSIATGIKLLRDRGWDVLLNNVDQTQTAEDLESMDADAHQLVVRDVSRTLWLQVRGEAVKRGQPAGAILNEILNGWLRRQESRP